MASTLLHENLGRNLNGLYARFVAEPTFAHYQSFLFSLIAVHQSNPSAVTSNLANSIYQAVKGSVVESQIINGDYSAFSQPRQVTSDMLQSINNPHGFKYAEQYYHSFSNTPASVVS